MVKLGFLRFNQHGRTFVPTSRVSLLGTWTESRLFRGGKIYELVENLAEETGCIIILSARDGVTSKCILSLDKHGLDTSRAVVGDVRALHKTAAGIALLGAMPGVETGKILRRIGSETAECANAPDFNKVAAKIAEANELGFVIAEAIDDEGYGEIAMTVDIGEGLTHALSCYGQRDRLFANADFIVDKMQGLIAMHLTWPKRKDLPQARIVNFPQMRAVAADAA